MSQFFADIGKKTSNSVPYSPLLQSIKADPRSLVLDNQCHFGEVKVQEFRNIVLSLVNSSAGFDQISATCN